jgi:hypothetical protein
VALEFLASPASEPEVAKQFEAGGDVQVAFCARRAGGIEILDVRSD